MPELFAPALVAALLAGGEAPRRSAPSPSPPPAVGRQAGFDEAAQRRRPIDPWLGEDKARHLGMSYAITTFSHGGARLVGAGDNAALSAALVLAGVAGIGKEIYDRAGGGLFSYRDLVADAIGIAAGVVVVRASR